jgi:RecA/RadA recombinase
MFWKLKFKVTFILSPTGGQTAWEILNEEKLYPRITTSCADLDNILGGGINCKEVTEIGQSSYS